MHGKTARRDVIHFCSILPALVACTLLALFPCSATAQTQAQVKAGTVRISSWPNGFVVLQGWRFHRGDNPAYAKPDFDDSSWQTVTLHGSRRPQVGVLWYRLRIDVPAHHGPLALNVFGLKGAYQVYMNGSLVPGPRLLPAVQNRLAIQTVPLPAAGNAFELAIRCAKPRLPGFYIPIFQIQLGTRDFIKTSAADTTAAVILQDDTSLPIEIACIFAGLAVLGLFYFQRRHKEYLWLGLYLITLGWSSFAFLGSTTLILPLSVNFLSGDPLIYLYVLFQIEFTFAFVHQKVSRPWRAYEILLLVSTTVTPFTNMMGVISNFYYSFYEILATLLATLVLPVLLWFWYRKGNREAGLLVIPSIFPGLASILVNINFVTDNLFHWHGVDFMSKSIQLGPFGFELIDLFNLIFLLAIGVVILLRFTEVSRAEARTAAELDAAREIQQTLVPADPPAVEGYHLAAAYIPATQVGGDFYQVLPQPDGGTLVVLGDVSGKGLKAAMTGTLAIGALRTLSARGLEPAELLADLNEQMVAGWQAGFITMLCARVGANGRVTLANAGHLHPYRSGEEVELDAGLPLGIVSGVSYAERQITLAPGETLTLISDGIVEARRENGELFGFERTQASSGMSAQQMAEAAQKFGQEDDITVLTLTRERAPTQQPVTAPAVPLPSPA